jgi:hypothetical protein
VTTISYKNRGSSVGIVTGYEPDGGGLIPDGARKFYVLNNVQTASGAHTASYPVGARCYFPWDKAAGA